MIEVGPHTGVVESVGLRVTKLRKFSGELRIVPNGELTAFGLHTAGWARLVVEVPVDYDEDVNRALRVLGEVGKAMADARPAVIFEPPTAEGILRFGQGGGQGEAILRLHARVAALEKGPLEFETRRRVKEAFAAHGIRIPRAAMEVRLTPPPGADPPRTDERSRSHERPYRRFPRRGSGHSVLAAQGPAEGDAPPRRTSR